jgi:hypothetical protein
MIPPGWYLAISCWALSTPYSFWLAATAVGSVVSALVP